MNTEFRDDLYNAVIEYLRINHEQYIDNAYDFYWEEEDPEEFASGTIYELGFVNFEDWLVCDYTPKNSLPATVMYAESCELGASASEFLEAMRNSVISLYEVAASDDASLTLKDLLLEETVELTPNPMPGLDVGRIFGTRVIHSAEGPILGRCLYPFSREILDRTLKSIHHTYNRYKKNKNTEGTFRDCLRDESYMMNMIWVSSMYIKNKQA